MSYTEHPFPDPLPERACESDDLFRATVYDPPEYDGHNGECENCGTQYSESDDSDLSNTHWMHTKKVREAIWVRDTPQEVRDLAAVMDPEDPMDATMHAQNFLAAVEQVR